MSDPWVKSLSYRQALDGLTQRFAELKQQDRIAATELYPALETIDGYLFAINSAPAVISPTEWLGDLLPLIQLPDEQPGDSVNMLISYQLHSKARMEQQKYALPDETDPLKAITAGSVLNSFSHGYERGYSRVNSLWSAMTPEELRQELDTQVFALTFFTSTDNAKKYISDKNLKLRPDQLAEQILANLPKAADLHVRLGMAVAASRQTSH
ncbi:UPF0149 family protein [Reinekea marinisedimentorum]|uniref:Uncharacterized protein UPF0149 n=1 Tax=Reinekea marinisedimentorum TaxID=230495 RepID=A0A4R3IDL4_9GAMM|nr:UPF0149 family protein [Reinekea marinisedimentorum]TCS43866.1 uncharacterized protein UPF0149 [Reinekea marinisedimentorum]